MFKYKPQDTSFFNIKQFYTVNSFNYVLYFFAFCHGIIISDCMITVIINHCNNEFIKFIITVIIIELGCECIPSLLFFNKRIVYFIYFENAIQKFCVSSTCIKNQHPNTVRL